MAMNPLIPSWQVPIKSIQDPNPVKGPTPVKGTSIAQPTAQQPTILGAESVRATGNGPFDSAYRQNLATYSGGQFQRPGGNLSFNPTAQGAGGLGSLGQPTGGGNAPVGGSPTDLLSMALGGQPFGAPGQQPPTTSSIPTSTKPMWQQPDWQQWLQQLTNQGGLLRGY